MATARRTKMQQPVEPAREPHPRSREARPELHEVPPQPQEPLRDDMMLTYAEAAGHIRKTPHQVARYVYNGWIPIIGVGREGIIVGRDLREFLEQRYRRVSGPASPFTDSKARRR